ncbi:hypothetical protein D3C75_1127850 [compost metagenome]
MWFSSSEVSAVKKIIGISRDFRRILIRFAVSKPSISGISTSIIISAYSFSSRYLRASMPELAWISL